MDIAEVRAKFLQYSDLSDQQLADGLHAKFYADMPPDQFYEKIGLKSGTSGIPGTVAKPQAPAPEMGITQRLQGIGDTAVSVLGTGISAPVGAAAGLLRRATGGSAEEAGQTADHVQKIIGSIFAPQTPWGKQTAQQFADYASKSPDALKIVQGLNPSEAVTAGHIAGPAAKAGETGAVKAAADVASKIADVADKSKPMAGGGAAVTEMGNLRQARADQFGIKLTEGQRTRAFAQQQFERETAKNPTIGEPIRQRMAEQNQQILKKFDEWVDLTGAETPSLRAAGQAVNDALVAKSRKAKGEINAAYTAAEKAGAMQERIDAAPLSKYLQDNSDDAELVNVLRSTQTKLDRLGQGGKKDVFGQVGPKTLSVAQLEIIRKGINRLSQKDATEGVFAGELRKVIDDMTEGKGGKEYRAARALRTRYAREFEDVGVIDKLLSTKPGSKDRAVAYEDVFGHSILKGSLDDVRAVRRTLQTGGPAGEQAWKELQGATVRHIKDEITKSVAPDINGNPVISPAKLNTLVTELDKDGKLDFVFGKQGAQKIRDINDIAKDVFTSPPGSVNHSNTASVLAGLLDVGITYTTGIPAPVATAATFGIRKVKERVLRSKVASALQ